jgi:uncharacterized membrane protein
MLTDYWLSCNIETSETKKMKILNVSTGSFPAKIFVTSHEAPHNEFMTKNQASINVYGRRGGRGLRPYLIMLKIFFVSVFLGGLVSFRLLLLLQQPPASTEQWLQLNAQIHYFFAYLVVPAGIGAEITGLVLLATLGRVMLKMRWFQVKMLILIIGCPSLHIFMSSRTEALKQLATADTISPTAAILMDQIGIGTLFAIGFALILIWLGRIKPRLGQNYARTFHKP